MRQPGLLCFGWPTTLVLGISLAACGPSTEFAAATGATSTHGTSSSGASSSSGGIGGAGGGTTSSSSGQGGAPEVYPAPHPAAPQIQWGGGPVVKSPKFVPVFFSNDDPAFTAKVKDFMGKLGPSSYWTAISEEYGVGAATALPPVEVSDAPSGPMSTDDLETWLTGKLDADDPAFPAADDDTIYALFFPPGVSLTDFNGSTSCDQFDSYHHHAWLDAAHGNQNVLYAAIPRCLGSMGGLSELELVTYGTSHELIEVATDPEPDLTPSYLHLDDAHAYWEGDLGAEVGDLCGVSEPDESSSFPGLDYAVQRSWSNLAAAAGHDPCVPHLPNDVYFNSAAVLNDIVTVPTYGSMKMKGVKIPVGETRTIDVELFSEAKTSGPWSVQAVEEDGEAYLSMSLDKYQGQNGDVLHLTIKVLKKTAWGAETFALYSRLGQRTTLWLGLVAN